MSEERKLPWSEQVSLLVTNWYRTHTSVVGSEDESHKFSALISSDIASLVFEFADGVIYPKGDYQFEYEGLIDGNVSALTVSSDGKYCFIGSNRGMITKWDLVTNRRISGCFAHPDSSVSCLTSKCGLLASVCERNTMKIWDETSGEFNIELVGHTKEIFEISFNQDASQLASGSDDRSLRVWESKTGECIHVFSEHKDSVISVMWVGDRLFSGSSDRLIREWDVNKGECILTVSSGTMMSFFGAFISCDASFLLCRGLMNTPLLKGPDFKSCGSLSSCGTAAFHPSKGYCVAVSANEKLMIYDLYTKDEIIAKEEQSMNISHLCFTPDGSRIIFGDSKSVIRVWDISEVTL